MNVTPENITELQTDECFTFGSNIAGRHGAGAARTAHVKFGARMGVGYGRTGRCFAIPTKDERIQTMPLKEIAWYVEKYLEFARVHPETKFLTTAVGCGLAGYTPKDIAPLFFAHPIPNNVYLPASFWKEKP